MMFDSNTYSVRSSRSGLALIGSSDAGPASASLVAATAALALLLSNPGTYPLGRPTFITLPWISTIWSIRSACFTMSSEMNSTNANRPAAPSILTSFTGGVAIGSETRCDSDWLKNSPRRSLVMTPCARFPQ